MSPSQTAPWYTPRGALKPLHAFGIYLIQHLGLSVSMTDFIEKVSILSVMLHKIHQEHTVPDIQNVFCTLHTQTASILGTIDRTQFLISVQSNPQ